MDTEEVQKGTWVILELFGHKVVAGYLTRDETLGAPLLRLDVPKTSRFPAFTRHYHPNAVYSISYVGEEAAAYTAESISENPISIYVPELGELTRLQQENTTMKTKLFALQRALQSGQLPQGDDNDDNPNL